ncbi:MAG: endonuclease, partial [Coprobacillus sp.]|nr:endonuclease [Coprobacillus sp.]
YTRYQSYAHKWSTDDIKAAGGTVTVGGLTWEYSAATYIGKDGQFDRGVQIGSNNNPQSDPWTISVDFGEDVQLTNISVQLFTTTSGTGAYSISFPSSSELGSGTYSTPGTDMEYAYSAEYSDISIFGDSLLISLWASGKNAFYLRSITFDIYTREDSSLNLVAEDLEDPEYDPQPVVPGVNNVKATKYTAIDDTWESYYSTWDLTLTGEALRSELQEKNEPQTRYTYDDVRYMFPYSDEDPDNPGYMLGCYDGDKIPAYWDSARTDREHVWPCAHMKITLDEDGSYRPSGSSVGHYSDLHNLRVSCKPVNNFKSDKYFDTYDDSNFFFPNVSDPTTVGSGTQHKYNEGDRTHDHRGDVARICLYMYAMYEELDLVDDFTSVNEDLTFGRLSTLLEWNSEDPVDDFETQRNNRIYEYQGNRNPF